MSGQVSPTRTALLASKAQQNLASQGADLLKRKRDALIGEFFALVKDALAAREALTAVAQDAYLSLFTAKAWDSPEAVESLGLAQSASLEIDMQVQDIYGVRVPKINVPEMSSELSFSPITVGAQTFKSAEAFQKMMLAIIRVAGTETKLRRIGEEIKKTSRRVNALEQVVIPSIIDDIRFIRGVLDQREREESFRLKKIKAKLEREEEADSKKARDLQVA